MKVLITGSAGFIGMHTAIKLLERGEEVIGIDNINDYYDINLKKARLQKLNNYKNFYFNQIDLEDKQSLDKLFFKKLL